MRLINETSIVNMGDTSIRVRQIVEVYKIILEHLDKFMKEKRTWTGNNALQEQFYRSFLEEINQIEVEDGITLFRDFSRLKTYSYPPKGKIGLRGRTLTNGLVKTGLINTEREISVVGKNYLEGNIKDADKLEEIFNLAPDNLIYLRQFLKLRIYHPNNRQYFYIFRFALKFLSVHENVPQEHFFKLILSIKPNTTESELRKLIAEYESVKNGTETFDSFYTRNFSTTIKSKEEIESVKEMFKNKNFTDENFIKYFNNRDSNETSIFYKKYVLALLQLVQDKSENTFLIVKKMSRDNRIKKAFGSNRIPFKLKHRQTVEHFFKDNKGHPLLSDNPLNIYLTFIFSKQNDLIREYSDMCRRTFQITGLIRFEQGLVNLNNRSIIKPLLDKLGDKFKLSGEDCFEDYELNPKSSWFQDVSTMEILDLSFHELESLITSICKQLGITEIETFSTEIEAQREEDFREFVENYFPKAKIIKVLNHIAKREDEEVYKLVTDQATISTIYEYILTIAWYHLSDGKQFSLAKSFFVTLDGNKLPLSHRPGGAGDIEIIAKDYNVLIEATLMDRNTQRRAELEPVIRHSINFKNEHDTKETLTIFVANDLDDNVLNVFRATQFIELTGTLEKGVVQGLSIFALTTAELIRLLQLNKKDTEIIDIVEAYEDKQPSFIKLNWRTPIIEALLNS